MSRKYSDQEFITAFRSIGSPAEVAKSLGISERAVYKRRASIENRLGITLESNPQPEFSNGSKVIRYQIESGNVLIGSDAHYWPGIITEAHKAFVRMAKKLKPSAIIMNGDVFDGARVSRHDPLFKSHSPTVKQEIEACRDRLDEISSASKNSKLFWTYGNHDTRIYRYVMNGAPELADLTGADLFSYFPGWHHGMVVNINDTVVVKHRWHNGGVTAIHNNVLKSGKTLITGHLHQLKVVPWSDYLGRRYGVDSGTLAEPYGEQFDYTEGNPVNWCSGFAVLTFRNGKMLPPELCEVIDGKAYFRGAEV
jgi:metallophosphoesterase superfamily enzyme